MTRHRFLLGLALLLFAVAGVRVWLYLHSPVHAVHCLESAYAQADAAAAAPWLTPRGQALFAAGIDPDVHSSIAMPKAEAQPAKGDTVTVRYHGLTRFGAVDADLRLLRQRGTGGSTRSTCAPWDPIRSRPRLPP